MCVLIFLNRCLSAPKNSYVILVRAGVPGGLACHATSISALAPPPPQARPTPGPQVYKKTEKY